MADFIPAGGGGLGDQGWWMVAITSSGYSSGWGAGGNGPEQGGITWPSQVTIYLQTIYVYNWNSTSTIYPDLLDTTASVTIYTASDGAASSDIPPVGGDQASPGSYLATYTVPVGNTISTDGDVLAYDVIAAGYWE